MFLKKISISFRFDLNFIPIICCLTFQSLITIQGFSLLFEFYCWEREKCFSYVLWLVWIRSRFSCELKLPTINYFREGNLMFALDFLKSHLVWNYLECEVNKLNWLKNCSDFSNNGPEILAELCNFILTLRSI